MIHFLVNNDYQYLEAERQARELRVAGLQTALIAIPHTLTCPPDATLFASIIKLETPARLPWMKAWGSYLRAPKIIKALLAPYPADLLIIFTEFELLNQLVAIRFKSRGAKAYLLEDGGVGTYIPLALQKSEPYSFKDRIKQTTIRQIPALRRTQFTKFDGVLIPMLDDTNLDGVFLYRSMSINRRLPVHVVARPRQHRINTIKGRVVFLNQPLYSEHIQPWDAYREGLRLILSALASGFDEVLFKFHPRESETDRSRVRAILNEFPAIQIHPDNAPFESVLTTIRPEAVASYNSTPLLNMAGTGIQPLFVYHLMPDLMLAPSFITMHVLLVAWGYLFPKDWTEVSSGFNAGQQFDDVQNARPLAAILGSLESPSTSSHPNHVSS